MINFCRKCMEDFTMTASQVKKNDYICKECKREYQRVYREKRRLAGNPVKTGKMSREYHAAYEAEYKNREGVKERINERAKKYRSGPNRYKHAARWETARAIRSGQLTRQSCEVCGVSKVDAHHDDYSKPLDVRWLCRTHHREHHAKAEGGAV